MSTFLSINNIWFEGPRRDALRKRKKSFEKLFRVTMLNTEPSELSWFWTQKWNSLWVIQIYHEQLSFIGELAAKHLKKLSKILPGDNMVKSGSWGKLEFTQFGRREQSPGKRPTFSTPLKSFSAILKSFSAILLHPRGIKMQVLFFFYKIWT